MIETYAVVSRVRAAEVTYRLVGEDQGMRDAYIEACRTLGARIAEARDALREIAELRRHRCDWNEDDYCNTCGADGRA